MGYVIKLTVREYNRAAGEDVGAERIITLSGKDAKRRHREICEDPFITVLDVERLKEAPLKDTLPSWYKKAVL